MEDKKEKDLEERVLEINRVSKKTKGGNKIRFSALVVVGDRKGRVGVGLGKADDVSAAVVKAVNYAKKRLVKVPIVNGTIPHDIKVKRGAAKILLKPAPAGSGIIAGGAVRNVVELAGIKNISSKILGTTNRASNIYATFEALRILSEEENA
jgi:small subunit ribosomal protein S5